MSNDNIDPRPPLDISSRLIEASFAVEGGYPEIGPLLREAARLIMSLGAIITSQEDRLAVALQWQE